MAVRKVLLFSSDALFLRHVFVITCVLLCRNCMESIVDKTYKCLKRDTKVRWIGFESVKVKDYPRRF